MDAQNVVDHFAYVQKAGGQMAPFLTGDTFTATDPTTVTITAKAPNPNFAEILTQDYIIGGVISPAGLKAPAALGTRTLGAGPYQLDTTQTIPGSSYTYVPNPNYYNKSAVHWSKVVIRVITSPQSALNAVRTGEADVSVGDPSTVGAAQKAGLHGGRRAAAVERGRYSPTVTARWPRRWQDPKVRQALNFATDRAAITTALFGGIGKPTAQITVPGGYGYDPTLDQTPTPTTRPRQSRCWPPPATANGFPLRLVTPQYQQLNLIAQALKQQWKQVGVDLQITDEANANQFASDTFGGKVPGLHDRVRPAAYLDGGAVAVPAGRRVQPLPQRRPDSDVALRPVVQGDR